MELNGAPLTCEASIWDFQEGTIGYIAHAVEQNLLLPKDMADLRSLRQHEVFLGLKRDLATQAVFRTENMVESSHRKMKEKEGKRTATVDAFHVAEKSNKELKVKLNEEIKERKSTAAALENAKKQAESQRLLLRDAEDKLATVKEQIAALQKKLGDAKKAKALTEKTKDEAVKAKEAAEQHRYEVGVAEIEDALRAEVPTVYRTYCALTWDEALNQDRVEASSMLRKAESVYYPPAIRPRSSADSKADPESSEVGEIQSSPPKDPPVVDVSLEGVQ
ncbi:uncharacterized protein LOC115952562 [Quercus lobata]|uniref:uncharacterized protein LOC115952562 n=1 Tax=Quercus lobata TaxID=97700 RepID=UPI001245BA04|nr:uncharacterized protein LOC115952562 [Quercus lobata]